MKIKVCDICLSQKILTKAKYTTSMKRAPQKVSLDVCDAHKDVFHGKTYPDCVKIANEALFAMIGG